ETVSALRSKPKLTSLVTASSRVSPDRFIPPAETFGKITSLPEMKTPDTTVAESKMKTSVITKDRKNGKNLFFVLLFLGLVFLVLMSTTPHDTVFIILARLAR
ncbi:MAG: hypothetical protein FWF80_02210, partial [Defluviitaleaceae bacterium]|nr:hypothetical protein [Defluviitaleaceae bacterium]